MARSSLTLPLPFGEPPAPPTGSAAAATLPVIPEYEAQPCLWLCLGFAQPSIEPSDNADALHRLAGRCLRLTPRISLDPSGALLLEVAGSVPLFGDIGQLCDAALSEVRQSDQTGHVVSMAVAPTARAALWLMRAGGGGRVLDRALLPGMLAALPLPFTGWSRTTLQLLERLGVRTLGQCLRLPRDGLARRIGATCLNELDEALGRRPELRVSWHPAEGFSSLLDLPADSSDVAQLMTVLSNLIGQLQAHLKRCQGGAQVLWIQLQHRRLPPTLLRIGLLRSSASAAHLQELAAIHLSSLRVPAPVTAILLEADLAQCEPAGSADLLGQSTDQGSRLAALIERLRMRLGLRAVHGLITCPEHRPERAWQALADLPLTGIASADQAAPSLRARPLWMLESPRRLQLRGQQPLFQGPLRLDAGPERIETGWWDGSEVQRDYFTATNPQGMRLWIFREHRSHDWYLHGLFG